MTKGYQITFCKVVVILLAITHQTSAQTFLGITADLGNRVLIRNDPGSIIKSPLTPSGSIFFFKQENIISDWHLQYGATLGTLGYIISYREEFDTISAGNDPDFYSALPNYQSIYASGNLSIGRTFLVRGKKFGAFAGCGLTYYWHSIVMDAPERCDGGDCSVVFEYHMQTPDEKMKWFADILLQTQISERMLLGLRYRRHFTEALKGQYQFYHISNPPSGYLSLIQKSMSVIFAVRLGKSSPKMN